ncbi:transposase family protein [Streptomyces lydicus]|uniref:transposase family protein n=1 Tax=Streptomyces lydicus TaxID=47763 RepID=UPI0037D123BC
MRVGARTTAGQAACPGCGCWSGRIHGSYLWFPRDLPTAGKVVVVSLRVQRFVCEEESCERKTFAEQAPGLTAGSGDGPIGCGRRSCRLVSRSRSRAGAAHGCRTPSRFRSAGTPC